MDKNERVGSPDLERIEEALPAYEVGEVLGMGGFGVVVAGRHRQLGREVAIKQLPRDVGADPQARARFVSEARVLATLDHPHIVPIYDFVDHDGLLLLVMEKLTGGTVGSRFRAQGFSQQTACAVVVAACSGLHHAHSEGILHRDVKPENMMFSSKEVLKVTDFGLAKVAGASQVLMTQTGYVLGTPKYLAPEQASGAELTPATDVYATGTVLYELLTGDTPFEVATDLVVAIYQRTQEDPRPLPATVATELASVVMRSLARDPAERQQSAKELGSQISVAAESIWGPDWSAQSGVVLRSSGVLPRTEPPVPVAATVHSPGAPTVDSPAGAGQGAPTAVAAPGVSANVRTSAGGESWLRRRGVLVGGLALVAALVVGVVLALSGGDSPKPPAEPTGQGPAANGPAANSGGTDPAANSGAPDAAALEEVVRTYLEAYNSGNLEAASALIAPGATIFGTRVANPTAAATDLDSYSCADDPQAFDVNGNVVSVDVVLQDIPGKDCADFTGDQSVRVYTVEDGKITSIDYG